MPHTSVKSESRFSLRSISRFFLGVVLGTAIIALVIFNLVLGWVATGPRDLDTFTPVIESALSSEGHYNVSVGKTQLIWNGWEHPLDIRLQDVSVSTSKRQRFSTFPVVFVGLDLWQLVQGNVLPADVTIEHPVVSLYQTNQQAIQFGVGTPITPQTDDVPAADAAQEDDALLPFEIFITQIIDPPKDSAFRKLKTVRIIRADISIGSKVKGVFFAAEQTNLDLRKNSKGVWLSGHTSMTYGEKTADIKAAFFLPEAQQVVQGDISFDAITPSELSKLFTHIPALNAIQFPVKGKAKLELSRSGNINHANLLLQASKGTIDHAAFENIIEVNDIVLDAKYTSAENAITVNDFHMNLEDEGIISATSTLYLKEGNIASVDAVINAYDIPNGSLAHYWPQNMSPMSREWITENISKGSYSHAQVYVAINEGDLEQSPLPKDVVNARVDVSDASIKYLPEHPELEHVDATLFMDAQSLQAVIYSGSVLESAALSSGHLNIPDLNAENPILDIAFNASASASDIVTFLGLPRLEHAKKLNLDATKITGSVDGSARVQFHFFAPEQNAQDDEGDIKYDVTAQLTDVTQKAIMSDFDVENATGFITVNNQYIDFVGSGTVNGAHSEQMGVSYRFKGDDVLKTLIQASATAPVSSLERFGYPGKDYLTGELGVDVMMLTGGDKKHAAVSLELEQANVSLTPARYKKPKGMPLTLSLVSDRHEGVIHAPLLLAHGDNLDALGTFNMDKTNSTIESLELSHVQHAKTDLELLHYKTDGENFSLKMRGKTADMSAWQQDSEKQKEQKPKAQPNEKIAYVPSVPVKGEAMKNDAEKAHQSAPAQPPTQEGFSFQNFPPMSMDIAVDTVVLGVGRELYDVAGDFSCNKMRCTSAHVTGKTADQKPFLFQIMNNPKGKRQLVLRAEGAGDFLRATDIFQGMYGGDLSITGEYEEHAHGSTLTGRIDGTGYVVKDAPVLARMLSLASLTGFFDTLSGKGITFKKMRAPFELKDDVLTITDGKTFGNAVGMTIEGNIFFPSQKLDLKGTVVPSYSINSVLGHVPLIGQALMGGEGEGVFAASYTIKGDSRAPEVMVNPLSILTPGFLRGLFDVFDTPVKKPKAK